MAEAWTLKGEMTLSCSCTVFCPCVLSLGDHPPTEDRCQTWAGVRIDEGRIDNVDLSGIKVGLMMDLPGIMSRGNWTAALFVDDKAPIQAVKGLTRIFTGRVGQFCWASAPPDAAASSNAEAMMEGRFMVFL